MTDTRIIIDGRPISGDDPPYVIAELSANHNGSLDRAIRIMDEAKAAGADAVKLQTYRPDTITLKSDRPDFRIEGGLWAGRTLYDLYDEAHMPWDWHGPLFEHARKIGITVFSTPFDRTAVDFLADLGAPAFKVASFEATDLPLIRYIASKGRPMIISTGMADEQEIREAIGAARGGGCDQIAILHCVSGYPAPASEYNLRTLVDMRQRFGVVTGLSDHTIGNTTAIAAVALGASLIEKHVTLDRGGGGPDDSFSLEPAELRDLCATARIAWECLGTAGYERTESERGNVRFRRSLYFVKRLAKGDLITEDAIRSVRPGYGLPPKYADAVIGRPVTVDVEPCTPVLASAVAGLEEATASVPNA